MRDLVAQSWERARADGIDADRVEAPFVLERSELLDYRAGHALSAVFPLLYDVLGRVAEDCDCVMAVGDCEGQLLWVCGRPAVIRRAEGINFVEGTRWGEGLIGTNAPGTALRLDTAVHISSREHFAVPFKDWSCSAAPIHDPDTGRILGVVDVTGNDAVDLPQTLAMVRSTARMAEAELGRLSVIRRMESPHSRSTPVAPESEIGLTALARPYCQFEHRGTVTRLSRRHSDLAVVLADSPEGVGSQELTLELYEEDVQMSTMRAQINRMRAALGAELVDSRPYRFRRRVRADWCDMREAITAHRLRDALHLYRGPLLPSSDAPGVVRRRDQLERDLVMGLLTSHDVDLLVSATRTRWGADNLELWERQLAVLPASSPLFSAALSEVRRLRAEYGLDPRPRVRTGRLHQL